jgi:AraC-like DNA-binding protein
VTEYDEQPGNIMKSLQHAQYIRDPHLEGVEVCYVRNSNHCFPNHFHDDVYAVGIMEKGYSYCLGPTREEALVGTGRIALINPGQVHSGVPVGVSRLNYTMLYVSAELMRETACDLAQKDHNCPEFSNIIIDNPALFPILQSLCTTMASPAELLEKQTLITESLSRILLKHCGIQRAEAAGSNESRAVRQAKELLSADIEAAISLDEAAETVGLSRYHFLRVFKKATGIPPHAYRTVKRIEVSKSLIKKGVPLSQVALETGFSDQSHFTNTFRNYIGSTPKQYLSGN